MKAIVHEKYGPPETLILKEVPKPVPADDEILIQICAAAVNSGDWRTVQGKPFLLRMEVGLLKPKKMLIGADMAGRVVEVGKNTTQFKPGDEVFGDLSGYGYGAFAEYVAVPESAVFFKPKNLSFLEAAAVPETGGVALRSLRDIGQIKPGDKVLIVGASGGIGTFAVQIAKAFGAEVTAVCSKRNINLVRSIGADHIIDYAQTDFTETGQHWDLIVATAGYHSLKEFKAALTPQGVYVMAGGDMKQIMDAVVKGKLYSKKGGKTLVSLSHHPHQSELIELAGLIESGKVKPIIDKVFSLKKTAEAISYYGKGKSRGKVVIQIRSEA